MKVTVQTSHLKAALCCAAVNDVCYYLKGVFVEVMPAEIRVVATDGNCAIVLRERVKSSVPPFSVIIPTDTITMAGMLKRPDVELQNVGGAWSLGGIAFTPVEGTFPSYRRIIPNSASRVAAHFDPAVIQRFVKAAKALGCKTAPIVRHNGDDGAQIQFYGWEDVAVGVAMPYRMFNDKHPDLGLSSWGST